MCADKNENNQSRYENNGFHSRRYSPRNSRGKNEPTVQVTTDEITRYLNAQNVSNMKMDGHFQRLKQKCLVKVRNDNLIQLRDSFKTADASCKICGKLYTSAKKLQNHHESKHLTVTPKKKVRFSDHVIIHEVIEYHSCRKCTKMFKNFSLLKKHMKKTHKKRKCYICNYCSKEFMDRFIFKVHIKLHCDACGLYFPTRAKYLEHRRNICKITKRYKCGTCNETCFRYMDLKAHSYDHIGTFFVCDICREQFQSYCQLSHHIRYLHTNQHPEKLYSTTNIGNEKLYQCNFCEKSYAYKILLEKHIEKLPDLTKSVMTGYEDYFFCDQCLMQFKNEKEVLEHKWSHFIKNDPPSELKEERTLFKLNEIPEHFLITKVIIKKSKEIEQKMQNIVSQPEIEMVENKLDESKLEEKGLEDKGLEEKGLEENGLEEKGLKEKGLEEKGLEEKGLEEKGLEEKGLEEKGLGEKVLDAVIPDKSLEIEEDNLNSTEPSKKKKNRKIMFSNFYCENCNKYYCSASNLRRHIKEVHHNFEDYQCKRCEETFVWPSLLASHKCLRLNHPEMPFDDARPEIQIENLYEHTPYTQNGVDPNVSDNYVDLDIPDPIVNIIEDDSVYVPPVFDSEVRQLKRKVASNILPTNQNVGYKLVLQEVPIEF